jgi:hypothetical protein
LWAIYFDGELDTIVAVGREAPIADCSFDSRQMRVAIADASLEEGSLRGSAASDGSEIGWDLAYSGDNRPLFLFHEKRYGSSFAKAKALVGNPNVLFSGRLVVNGMEIPVDAWQGSENHNWGSRHTDSYAWGQVAGFDNDPDAFLEVASARLKIGPVWTPILTTMVLRLGGEDHAINSLFEMTRAKAGWDLSGWTFENRTRRFRIRGRITADASRFVRLRYRNPPGGVRCCLNCKIAEADVVLEKAGQPAIRLFTRNRAAFEILTDE